MDLITDPLYEVLNPYELLNLAKTNSYIYSKYENIFKLYEETKYLKNDEYIKFIKKKNLYFIRLMRYETVKKYNLDKNKILKLLINKNENIDLEKFNNIIYLKIFNNKNIILTKLKKLETLILEYCDIPIIQTYNNLKKLICIKSNLTKIEYQPNLKYLDITDNKVTELQNIPKSEYINLKNNPISSLPYLKSNTIVNITGTNIKERYIKNIKIINRNIIQI